MRSDSSSSSPFAFSPSSSAYCATTSDDHNVIKPSAENGSKDELVDHSTRNLSADIPVLLAVSKLEEDSNVTSMESLENRFLLQVFGKEPASNFGGGGTERAAMVKLSTSSSVH